jgi:hypothetical protein
MVHGFSWVKIMTSITRALRALKFYQNRIMVVGLLSGQVSTSQMVIGYATINHARVVTIAEPGFTLASVERGRLKACHAVFAL